MKALLIITTLAIVLFFYDFILILEERVRFDYQIDLREDSLYILTDQNLDTTIHFDDLEEYIIRDNI